VEELVSDAGERRWIETELRALVGVGSDETAGASAETAIAAWRRFLEAIGERGPAVLVFEDLHWADDGLLDLVDDLVEWVGGVPLLIAASARPELLERRRSWGGGKRDATTISLQPLADDDTGRLISALLPRPLQLSDERQALLERAGGNPLFAEQYVRMLSERGTTAELPESVQGVIAARLDALPRPEKELLQEAAVHGKVFWLGGVAEARGMPAPGRPPPSARAGAQGLRPARARLVRRRRHAVRVPARAAPRCRLRPASAPRARREAPACGGLDRRSRTARRLRGTARAPLQGGARAGTCSRSPGRPRPRRAGARKALQTAGERTLALSAYGSAAERFADALALAEDDASSHPRLLLLRARAIFALGGAGPDLLTEALEGFRAAGDVEGSPRRRPSPPASRGMPATARRPTASSPTPLPPSPTDPQRGHGRRR
jgi:hypothetical protein